MTQAAAPPSSTPWEITLLFSFWSTTFVYSSESFPGSLRFGLSKPKAGVCVGGVGVGGHKEVEMERYLQKQWNKALVL